MQKNKISKSLLLLMTLSMAISCQKQSADDSNSNRAEEPELDLCSTSTAYEAHSTLNGTATFSKRGLSVAQTSNQVTRFTLGGLVTGIPIRYAEIRVLNSSGAVVQCGQTNGSGALKALDGISELRIPATAGTYTVQVLSRTNYNPTVPGGKPAFTTLFSVKEDIYSNTLYKTTALVTTTGANTYNNVNSNATGAEGISAKIEGGAFNIYNDIITSYEYLANNTGTQNISCLNPKMSVYWKAGFNPNQYIYPQYDPADLGTVSFYLRSDKELYINGGVLGNVSSVDTDHFDDSVIIHELGHHIENVCGTMDLPGGSHSGASRIDPRLSWSEARGNFFGAHIIRNNTNAINPNLAALLPNNEWNYYFDSEGYSDGSVTSGYEYLKFNLARIGNSSTTETIYGSDGTGSYDFDRVNSSTNPGEGHLREVAISRALFKSTNTCAAPFANCADENNFNELWKSFEKTSTGMGQSIYPFRSSVRFLDRFKSVKGGSLSNGLLTIFETDEAMQLFGNSDYVAGGYTTWAPYGTKLVPSGVACPLKIIPKSNNSSSKSDQRFSNHFYYINKNLLPGVTSIRLTKTYVTGSTGLDVDLLLFNEGYKYNEDCNGSTCSRGVASDVIVSERTSTYPKSISLSDLSLSTKALLNVRVYTPSSISTPTEYTYTLTDQTGGTYLCPDSSL